MKYVLLFLIVNAAYLVAAPSAVMEMDDVLEAKTASVGGVKPPNRWLNAAGSGRA